MKGPRNPKGKGGRIPEGTKKPIPARADWEREGPGMKAPERNAARRRGCRVSRGLERESAA